MNLLRSPVIWIGIGAALIFQIKSLTVPLTSKLEDQNARHLNVVELCVEYDDCLVPTSGEHGGCPDPTHGEEVSEGVPEAEYSCAENSSRRD